MRDVIQPPTFLPCARHWVTGSQDLADTSRRVGARDSTRITKRAGTVYASRDFRVLRWLRMEIARRKLQFTTTGDWICEYGVRQYVISAPTSTQYNICITFALAVIKRHRCNTTKSRPLHDFSMKI